MILLMEQIGEDAANLIYSLDTADYAYEAVSINYDGFLPDGAVSPYAYYVFGGRDTPDESVKPLYFDRLPVPALWEIESSNNSGELFDYEQLRARIFYATPKENRFVRIVDWLDKNGKVRFSDHYDKYGRFFARTVLDRNQKPVHKSYFDRQGREVITENLLTGDIILTEKGRNAFFHTKSDFVVHFLTHSGRKLDRVLFNSLSVPFFAAEKLRVKRPELTRNVLFWQEPIGDDIPGNMKTILEGGTGGVETIAVQKKDAAEKIRRLPVDQKRFCPLGYIYPHERTNTGTAQALVFTNSDQIEKLGELADALPEVQFHIGAITEMSSKLMAFERRPNVTLYPTIEDPTVKKLWNRCDLYLDINHGGEILSAVRTAFVYDQLIFGLESTLHNRRFTAPENIFTPDNYGAMADRIRAVLHDGEEMKRALTAQREHAFAASAEDYRRVLGQ